MPNWKKLIVSGSDASLNSLNVTNNVTAQSFTGSFSGSFTAPGATTQVVYNSGGTLAASSNFVFSGSNVGIGTSSPTDKLAVDGNISIFATNKLYNGSTQDSAGISFPSNVVRIDGFSGITFNSSTTNIGSQTERMRITNDGNVGIGTSSPSYKLDVTTTSATSPFRLSDTTTVYKSFSVNYASSFTTQLNFGFLGRIEYDGNGGVMDISNTSTQAGSSMMRFIMGTTERMRITDTGNVGIGTSSPGAKLHVGGGEIRVDTGQAIMLDVSNTMYLVGASNQLRLYNGGNPVVNITTGGNVGIGTTSPDRSLLVSGSIGAFVANGQGTVSITVGEGSNVNGNIISLETDSTANTTRLYNNGTGTTFNIGSTGTSADVSLSSRENLYFKVSNGGDVFTGTTAMFVSSSGNVGIGTTTPTATLEVNGNVKAVSFTGSLSGSATNAVSASYALSSSYALTSSYALSASYAITASHALTASYVNPLNQDLILTGSFIATGGVTASNALINGNLTVIGTASFTYTTSSIVNVGASVITLNTDNPAVRFGGISVIDSGSFGTSSTGSLFWDSEKNRWIYSNPSGSTYDGGLLISGPRNTTGLGNEQGTTLNALMKGQGGDHITSSGVFEVSGNVGVGTSTPAAALHIIGSGIVNIVQSTSSVSYTQYYNTSTGTGGTNDGFTVGNNGTDAYVFNRETSNLILGTSDTEAMRITSTGNVGIGITSPSDTLDVGGAIRFTSVVNPSVNGFSRIYTSFAYAKGETYIAPEGSTNPTRFFPNGGVVIGTTNQLPPTNGLTVSGNVGIGTASPTATLEVNGNVKAVSFTGSFSGSVSAPGSTTQIVYNDNGVLAANSGLVYSGSNVGIGISAPTDKLHIVSSATGNQFGRITATDSAASAAWVAQNDSGDNVVYRVFGSGVGGTQMGSALGRSASLLANLGGSGVFLLGTFSNTDFILGTNNTENMRITTAGNVGIGTTSPTSKLDVRGTLTVSGSGANVDIKSSTTTSTLNIYGSDTSTNFLGVGILSDNVTRWRAGMVDSRKYQIAYADGGGSFTPTAAMTIVSGSGNVGIGVTNPSYKLDVNGSFNFVTSGVYLTYNSGVLYHGDYYQFPSGTYYYLYGRTGMGLIFGSNNAEVGRFDLSGNLGIGTSSPLTRLDLRASTNSSITPLSTVPDTTTTLLIGNAGTNGVLALGHDNAGHPWLQGRSVLANQAAEDILINPLGGNVGIGTSSPGYKLEVVGAVSASTYYGDGSNLTGIGSGSVAAAGSDGQLQYNNSGLFGGASRLYYNDSTNRVGIGTSSPGYDLDVSGSARVQDRLRVGVVNTGNGVIHQSSDATINPTSATVVWSVPGSAGICAFIEYYVFNSNTGTSQRAGNIVTTWNASGTPQITHTETSTPDIGSTSPITFSTSLTLGGDPQLIATNSGGDIWYMIMNYRYF